MLWWIGVLLCKCQSETLPAVTDVAMMSRAKLIYSWSLCIMYAERPWITERWNNHQIQSNRFALTFNKHSKGISFNYDGGKEELSPHSIRFDLGMILILKNLSLVNWKRQDSKSCLEVCDVSGWAKDIPPCSFRSTITKSKNIQSSAPNVHIRKFWCHLSAQKYPCRSVQTLP